MEKITSSNLLHFIISYFKTLRLESEASQYFTGSRFESALVLNLAGVCLVTQNRPSKTKGNQTHIHVTGSSREFFFDKEFLDSGSTINIDTVRDVIVSKTNINSLNKLDMSSCTTLNLVKTTTNVKYSAGHQAQVQVSKIRSDGKEFIDLRKGLHLHDLLIFLKANDEELFAVGIPTAFYENKFEVQDGLYATLESKGNFTIKTALSNLENTIDTNTIVSNEDELSDCLYQQLVDDFDDDIVNTDEEESYKNEDYVSSKGGTDLSTNRPKTNPSLGKKAIKANKYRCIFCTDDNPHNTFIKPNGKPYMEAHHIIPVSKQDNFKKKLDTIGNIVPVCPLCHRKLHHGQKADVDKMLTSLYDTRNTTLRKSGLIITENDLKSFYR